MTRQSSPWVERLAERLVPPGCAEGVLGDLAETSRTPHHYLQQLLSLLPHVVWSQVRRRVTIGGIVASTIFSALFLVLSQRVPKEPFLDSPENWARLAVVLFVWVCTSVLAAAYGPADRPMQSNTKLLLASIAASAGTAAALGVPVLRVMFGLALLIGLSLLMTGPLMAKKAPPPLSLATVGAHAQQFQNVIWWRNLREALGAAAVLFFNARDLMHTEDPLAWAGHVLLVAGTLFIIGYLLTRAGSRRVPAEDDPVSLLHFHRSEIVRQRDILRAVPTWYLLPFVPGAALIIASKWHESGPSILLAAPIFAMVLGLVWALNVWAARFLTRQLAEVDGIER